MNSLQIFTTIFLIHSFAQENYVDGKRNFTIDDTLLPYIDDITPWFMCLPSTYEDTRRFVSFHHYVKEDPDESKEIKINDTESLSNWKHDVPVRIFIHGFLHSKFSSSSTSVKKAYLDNGNYNVIVVDWALIAQSMCYRVSALKVDEIGKLIAELITFLRDSVPVPVENIYLIGHSLGAQIAGAAGKYLDGKLPVIFALDPAGPLFRNQTTDNRVDPSDAQYVEVIHTDAQDGYGIDFPVGHADFYVNGGGNQPGCLRSSSTAGLPSLWLSLLPNWIKKLLSICSHERSFEFFAESVRLSLLNRNSEAGNTTGFYGYLCNDVESAFNQSCTNPDSLDVLQPMGGEPYVEKSGIYFLLTSNITNNNSLGRI